MIYHDKTPQLFILTAGKRRPRESGARPSLHINRPTTQATSHLNSPCLRPGLFRDAGQNADGRQRTQQFADLENLERAQGVER